MRTDGGDVMDILNYRTMGGGRKWEVEEVGRGFSLQWRNQILPGRVSWIE